MSYRDKTLDALLNGYVDGQLSRKTRDKYAIYLDSHPEAQAEAELFDELNTQLRTTFGDKLNIPVSDGLERFVTACQQPRGSTSTTTKPDTSKILNSDKTEKTRLPDRFKHYFNAPHLAIYASIVALSLSFTYLLPLNLSTQPTGTLAFLAQIEQLALDAHQIYSAEKRHAVEVPASDKKHLMKWLSKRLSAEIGPAKLDTAGYHLIGGRLLPSAGKRAALYMYADKKDRRLSLYIRQMEGTQTDRDLKCNTDQQQASICTWQGEKMLYLLLGPPGNTSHKQIAIQTAKQLNK